MRIFKVEILNPKAIKLLKNLADLNLIAINDIPENGFSKTLVHFRAKGQKPSLEEITAEVESFRTERYDS
ncbi:MAG: hypothetical protein JST50_20060 [Bacteroidetes bacterium]|jgi:hypothetical protein|nr:hypothetical protein [Bacteroidota bacterium]